MATEAPDATMLAFFATMETEVDVARLLGTSYKRLGYHLYSPKRLPYRHFTVPKASGAARQIAAPPPIVAAFQHELLRYLTAFVRPKSSAHGFTLKRSVVTNATPHVRAHIILNFDLLDFFPTITSPRVYGMFLKHPFNYPRTVAAILTQLCCDNQLLPQGAPTSPIISNLICRGLDNDLGALARSHHCRYTRYCDDVTVSTRRPSFDHPIASPAGAIGDAILQIVERHGFQVNHAKTRTRTSHRRQEVTGLTVNQHVNVPRRFVRHIRSVLHACETHGLKAAAARTSATGDDDAKVRSLVRQEFGKIAYMKMVRGPTDFIYMRLAARARQVFKSANAALLISGSAARRPELLTAVTWVLLGRSRTGEQTVEATAFSLAGYGIVTALHAFEEEVCFTYELRPSHDVRSSYPVTAVRSAPGLDLAILESTAPIYAALPFGDSRPAPGDEITLTGYPVWRSEQDGLFVTNGYVTQVKSINDIDFFTIDKDIHAGNSGGPVLSQDGSVIGVAVYDRESRIAPNGAIFAHHLDIVRMAEPESPYPTS